ncbi:unnamed protein product, partial [Rangifer tarandus platyrhynchus]
PSKTAPKHIAGVGTCVSVLVLLRKIIQVKNRSNETYFKKKKSKVKIFTLNLFLTST